MARAIEQLLAALRRVDPTTTEGRELVRGALVVKAAYAGVAVAAAAQVVGEHGLADLTPELAAAFTALCQPKRDVGCRGRIAIVHALHALGRWVPEVFEVGLRLVQIEGDPMYPDDSAAPLRGACAHAHVHFLRPDALDVCAEMLADPWRAAKLGALHGLGDSGRIDATAVLRLKLALGPDEGEVLAACFDALFALDRERGIEVARAHLGRDDGRSDAAALALGSQRATEATEALLAWCETDPSRRRSVGYLALALLRSDAGNQALVAAIRTAGAADARAAAEALATFKEDAATAKLLTDAAGTIEDKTLRAELIGLAR
jgi:hypothetical protein